MIIRQALNFTAHLVAGMAVGALAIAACKARRHRDRDRWAQPVEKDGESEPIEAR